MQQYKLLPEMTHAQQTQAILAFSRYALRKTLINHRNEKKRLSVLDFTNTSEVWGFAYCSSSSHALITLDTNEAIREDGSRFKYSHLAMDIECQPVLVCLDDDENEKTIKL